MNKTPRLAIGDEVWVYDPPCLSRQRIVSVSTTDMSDYGHGADYLLGYHVDEPLGDEPTRFYVESQVFAYPDDLSALRQAIEDHQQALRWMLDDLRDEALRLAEADAAQNAAQS